MVGGDETVMKARQRREGGAREGKSRGKGQPVSRRLRQGSERVEDETAPGGGSAGDDVALFGCHLQLIDARLAPDHVLQVPEAADIEM